MVAWGQDGVILLLAMTPLPMLPLQGKNPVTIVAPASAIPDYAVTFTYVARDPVASSKSREAFVHVLVRSPEYWNTVMNNKPPRAVDLSLSMDEATTLAGQLDAEDDFDSKEQLTFSLGSVAPAHGTLELEGAAFVYTPDPGFWGQDSFTFKVVGGSLCSWPTLPRAP